VTDDKVTREQALARWIPPEHWSPELKAAIQEMAESTATAERIEQIRQIFGGNQ